jgi:hypothetical protein
MSPKPVIRIQAFFLSAFVVVLAIFGYPRRAAWIAAALLLIGLALRGAYAAFAQKPLPDVRVELDRFMILLMAGAIGAAGALSVFVAIVGAPVHARNIALDVWLTVPAVIAGLIYTSSLLDWYIVLPRLGGLGGWPQPCTVDVTVERTGWRVLTQFWFGQRLITEFLSISSIDGAAIYLSFEDAKHIALWVTVGGLMTIVVSTLSVAWAQGWSGLHNPSVRVGGCVRAFRPGWEPPLQSLYFLDLDLRRLGGVPTTRERLSRDGEEDPTAFDPTYREVKLTDTFDPLSGYAPPCADGCRAVNWYCRHNPRAYDQK